MTTATTRIEITAKDSTAAAFASAENNLSSLAGTALKTAAGVAGIGLSIAGAVESIKSIAQATIQFQQFTNTLQVGTGSAQKAGEALSFVRAESQRLGLDLATAADQFGKLTAASKGTALEGQATREIFSSVAAAATAMGLSAEQTSGSLLAIQQIISKGTVSAEELRGQLGERLPSAFQIAARSIGVTTQELDKLLRTGSLTAEQFLPAFSKELNKAFGAQAEQSAKGLNAQMNLMNNALFDLKIAIGESGLISFLSSGIELATKLTNALAGVFGGGAKVSPIQKQVELIQTLESELTRMKGLNDVVPFFGNFIFSKKEQDELSYRLETARQDLERMKAAALVTVKDGSTAPTVSAKVTEDSKKATVSIKEQSKAQDYAIAREHEYIKLLQIQRKAQADLVKPYLDSANAAKQRYAVMTDEIAALKLSKDRQISLESAIELTTIARLEEKRAIEKDTNVIAQINAEIAARKKMLDVLPEIERLRSTNKVATDEMSQLWVQAGRNIQTSLGNLVFDFFSGGLDNMVKNAGNAVLRIMSEFAGLRIAQSIGLAGLFTAGSAAASTGATAAAGGNLLSIASLGSSAFNLFKYGGGISQGVASLFGVGGTQAAAQAGAMALWGSSGAATGGLSGMASGLAGMAGPAIALFAVDAIGRMLAGDKMIGGGVGKVLNFVPVLGPLLNGLFGRGQMKQQGTLLSGEIGAEGFESGFLQTRFKAKGGLFRSDKIDYARVDAMTGETWTDNKKLQGFADDLAETAREVFGLINDTTKQTSASLRQIGQDLGISTEGIDKFGYSINLLSEKGKMLTEEQIGQEIEKITDGLARSLLPQVDELAKRGETAAQTISRLGQEFGILEQAALSTGRSFTQSRDAILGMSIAARTGLINQLGGVDAASQKISFFMDNFLSDSDKTRILFERLDPEMKKLGFSAAITRGEFVKLVQSVGQAGGITTEQYAGLLNLAGSFDQLDKIRTQLTGTTGTLVDHERSLLDIRNELASAYQKERGALQNNISAFSQLATNIKSARDGLLLGDLSPLTPQQRLEEARNQFNQVRAQAGSGDQNALAQLPQVAQNFLKASQVYNASGAAYQSDFGLVQNVLQNAEKSALSQVDLLQSQLTKLDDSVSNLIDINSGTKTTNDLLKEIKAAVLSGSGNPGITTDQIRSYLSANPGLTPDQVASAAAQYGVSGSQLSAAGYNIAPVNQSLGGASVTDQQIRDFISAHTNDPMAIYKAAVANGISSGRLSSAGGIALADIQEFVRKNNLPSFAVGTDFVSRTGLAMVHRAEAIVPSSAIDEIKKLREEVTKLREEQNRQTGDMIKVIDITNRQNAEIIAKSNRETSKDQQWSDRSKTKLA